MARPDIEARARGHDRDNPHIGVGVAGVHAEAVGLDDRFRGRE